MPQEVTLPDRISRFIIVWTFQRKTKLSGTHGGNARAKYVLGGVRT